MPLELSRAVTPEEALIALRDVADLCDCDVDLDLVGETPGPYGYVVRLRERTTLRTVVLGAAARIGELGRAICDVLGAMTHGR